MWSRLLISLRPTASSSTRWQLMDLVSVLFARLVRQQAGEHDVPDRVQLLRRCRVEGDRWVSPEERLRMDSVDPRQLRLDFRGGGWRRPKMGGDAAQHQYRITAPTLPLCDVRVGSFSLANGDPSSPCNG